MIRIFAAEGLPALSLLEHVLAECYQIQPFPVIMRTPAGKPYFSALPGLHFSLSHSGSLSLCALSDRPVGADIEIIRPRNPGLPRYALTEEEYGTYLAQGGDWPAFYVLWTKKEAWCKYTGRGLGAHFRQTPPEKGLHFGAYGSESFRACVCGDTAPPEDIVWWEKLEGLHYG